LRVNAIAMRILASKPLPARHAARLFLA
jgi:hypothetical protein